ncbi:MAG: hypothetical protein ACQEVA_21530 [Myxococcota bacterium]
MQDLIYLLVISTVFGLLVWAFFRVMFRTSPGYHEPPEPMDASGWTLVVDGSNFAHKGSDVRLEHLQDVLSSLQHYFRNANLRVFCDANLRHKFNGDDKRQFKKLLEGSNRKFRETHGQAADDVILKYAGGNPRCIVVSNDWFSKGDEVQMRLDIPLLRIERTPAGEVFPHRYANIFDDPDEPEKRKRIPVRQFVTG